MKKNALFMSVLSLLLCVSMLVGTTFAWFTDEVVSGNNVIAAGNLDIELEYYKDSKWNTVKNATDLFSTQLWEPGHTQVVYLRLSNLGTLALKYQLGIHVASETPGVNVDGDPFNLSDHIEYGVVENINGETGAFADRAAARKAVAQGTKLSAGYSASGEMLANAAPLYMALVVYMPESVDNVANYRGDAVPTINLGVKVAAEQMPNETDSFDKYYDYLGEGGISASDAPETGTTEEYAVYSAESNVKIATMNISADSVEDPDEEIVISVIPTEQDPNVTVDSATQLAQSYDITVSNIKEDNATAIKVELNVGPGKSGVQVYHNGTPIESTYNESTGYVIFNTTSFSPYTIVYDAEYKAPETDEQQGLPKAVVTETPEYVGVDLPWNNYGGWAPTEGLDSQLEAAYQFSCKQTLEEAKLSPYADWHCDFYVKLDKDLGQNQILLGGNYGSFGWVGFHNGELELEANTEIPLLGSVTQNPWTYLAVVQNVGTFICGVGDVDDALSGATFTVMLRLTNPDDATEYYNIETINYTFE